MRVQQLPQTLSQWLASLRRTGVRCRLQGGGERISGIRVTGLRSLAAQDRRALVASIPQVRALLEQRAAKRRPKEKQQQQVSMPQEQRTVVGQIVNPGWPLRLLYEDECRPINPSPRARQLVGLLYGWSK